MKRWLAALLAFCMTMAAAGAMAAACDGYTEITDKTESGIQARLDAGGKYCLGFTDLDNAHFVVKDGKTVELCLHDFLNCRLIEIETNANLTLKNAGNGVLNGWIVNDGTLNIRFDSEGRIQKNPDVTSGGTYVVENKNTVVMENGTIEDPVLNKKSFTMKDGRLNHSVVNDNGATFLMEGGSIRGGGADTGSGEGIVENKSGATFTMNGEDADANFLFHEYENGELNVYAGTVHSADGKLPAYNVRDYDNHPYIHVKGTISDFNEMKLVVSAGNSSGGNEPAPIVPVPGGNAGPEYTAPAGGAAAADMPQTGDPSMLGAWVCLLGASAAGLKIRRKK